MVANLTANLEELPHKVKRGSRHGKGIGAALHRRAPQSYASVDVYCSYVVEASDVQGRSDNQKRITTSLHVPRRINGAVGQYVRRRTASHVADV